MIKTKIILPLLLLSSLLVACDKGDDLREIFLAPTWKLSFFQEGSQKVSPANNSSYTLKFYDTTFAFTTKSGTTITGYWQADNKERTFSCSQVRVSNGSIDGDDTARRAEKILKKGTQLYVEGKLRTRSWEDKDGNKRYITEVLAENFTVLANKNYSNNQEEDTVVSPIDSILNASTDQVEDLPF
ncbi:MAG: single-stranded DNA-binding protein [Bacteroidales bacterium]|nr:single-stranded DNA-binding protein [Bacteroidales bacterium]